MTELRNARPAKLPADWPFAEASRMVDLPPHRWHVQLCGTGPVLLLIHGAGASTHSWRHMIGPLSRSYRVMALDLPGQGFTETRGAGRLNLPGMAEDILRLLDHLDIRPAGILGHSAGAAIMLQMALDRPDMATIPLVSINGALGNFQGIAGVVFPIMAKLLALNPLTAPVFSFSAATEARVSRLIASTGSRIEPAGLEQYRRLIARAAHVDATLTMMANWSLDRLLDDLPRISNPCLFLAGSEDGAVPADTSARAADRIPGADLVTVPGLGHLLHEEAPEVVLDALDRFLAKSR